MGGSTSLARGQDGARSERDHEPRGPRSVSSPFGTAVLICNVRSGKGGVGKALPEVEAALRERGLEYEIRRDRTSAAMRPRSRERGGRPVVDSSSRWVVTEPSTRSSTGCSRTTRRSIPRPCSESSPLAPARTSSRRSGLPANQRDAVRHLDGRESFLIDIGKVTYMQDGAEITRYFPNIAEVGSGGRRCRAGRAAPALARPDRLPRGVLALHAEASSRAGHGRRRRSRLRGQDEQHGGGERPVLRRWDEDRTEGRTDRWVA